MIGLVYVKNILKNYEVLNYRKIVDLEFIGK